MVYDLLLEIGVGADAMGHSLPTSPGKGEHSSKMFNRHRELKT